MQSFPTSRCRERRAKNNESTINIPNTLTKSFSILQSIVSHYSTTATTSTLSMVLSSYCPIIATSRKKTDQGEKTRVAGPYDVLCSRSRTAHKHVGNRRFKIIAELKLLAYKDATTKLSKSLIVTAIHDTIRSAGGEFLRKNRLTGVWEMASDVLAQEKIGHTLRSAIKAMQQDNGQHRTIFDVMAASNPKKQKVLGKQTTKGSTNYQEPIGIPKATLSSILMKAFSTQSFWTSNQDDGKQIDRTDLTDSLFGDTTSRMTKEADDEMKPIIEGELIDLYEIFISEADFVDANFSPKAEEIFSS